MNAWLKPASLLPLIGLTWIGYWWKAGDVSITGNVHPAIALMEQDVILSCQVGGCSPSNLEVWLYKWGDSKKNALYNHSGPKQGKIQEGSTGERPENATHKGQFHNGVLEVTLFRVEAADSGQYVCAMTCGRVHKQVTMDVKVTGVINVAVGEGAVLPCDLKETHELSHWKLRWRRIYPGKIQTIYTYQYVYPERSPTPYSEHIVHNRCSHSDGPSIREWLGKKYEKKAEVFVRNRNGSLKLNNIQKDDAGRYQCSVSSNSFSKTINFKLSAAEIPTQDTEILRFFCFAFLYFLAFFMLFCFAAYIVGHKRYSGVAEEQKNNGEQQKLKIQVEEQTKSDDDEEGKNIKIQGGKPDVISEQNNYAEELQKLRRQVEEQKNYEEELRTQIEEQKTNAEELQRLTIQVEQKCDAEELRKLRSQVEEQKNCAEELHKLRRQVEEHKNDAEELRKLRIEVEEQKNDVAELRKLRIEVEELRKLRFQVEEREPDAELQELRSQVEEQKTNAEELQRLRIQVEEQRSEAEELRNFISEVEERTNDAEELQKSQNSTW